VVEAEGLDATAETVEEVEEVEDISITLPFDLLRLPVSESGLLLPVVAALRRFGVAGPSDSRNDSSRCISLTGIVPRSWPLRVICDRVSTGMTCTYLKNEKNALELAPKGSLSGCEWWRRNETPLVPRSQLPAS
jgi:hypothetical protein